MGSQDVEVVSEVTTVVEEIPVENAVLELSMTEEAQCPLGEVSLAAEQQEASVEEILVKNVALDVEEDISSVEAQCPLEEISLTDVAETLLETTDNNVEVFEAVLESKEENVVSEAVVENSTEEVEESSYIGEFPDDETMKAAVQQLKKELLEVVAEHQAKINEENEQMSGVAAEEVVGVDGVVEENQEPLVIDEELFEK